MQRTTGTLIQASLTGHHYRAFIPQPLPPNPPLQLDNELEALRDRANRALGRLDGISAILPDTRLFLYQYVRKEAVLSSQIEGTVSSLSDLLLYEMDEAPGVPLDDVREVSNYVAALEYGLEQIRAGMPISLRLLKNVHGILLRDGRGGDKLPGEFRRSQVWLGGGTPAEAEFVPPPPDHLLPCLDPFEKFLHGDMPVLLKAALAHVQFETIHPFKDGNGRLGRLLITLLLCAEQILSQPMLYLSLYFKQNRQRYYDRLQAVRTDGDWESWLRFFYTGLYQTAQAAVQAAQDAMQLFAADRAAVQQLGRGAGTALRLHQFMQERPLCNIPTAARQLKISPTAAGNGMNRLEDLGIVEEITGQQRYRVYAYRAYLNLLGEGTEPLRR